ncbi:sugar ABC transporter permease [Petrotoga sp. HWH.PT.55.6.1]|uniref:carbohydrate ABC transporter permease n=1 Tax=unclassified Petrotoga TaxID=2620614 RepID=UPI000CA018EB|nr:MULTISPECIES: sugar ABC transporter permease [unclassified Petrotoga]PNR91237.1 sugar ABC transporter permease [Petrotoga sp. HWHPT.55.6.3]RPD35072.1 sugar ABC transporter permease [Petrotoga sp. HWH.PT.55.6.1]
MKRNSIKGYLFFLPFGVLYGLFLIYPLINGFRMSFFEWDLFGEPQFIGLENFSKMFNDPTFWSSLWHTIYFVILTVPILVILGFLMALLLNSNIYMKRLFRMLFFFPYILSITIVCSIWVFLYQPNFGIIEKIFEIIGINYTGWLLNPKTAMPAIALTTIWWTLGFNVILYLAGLQEISESVYEAATIDGANSLQKTIFITIPLLKRTHALVLVLQTMASLQIFGQVYIMTGGGPQGSTRVLIQYIYDQGFRYFRMGYAQAMALFFFAIMFVIAFIQIRLTLRTGGE